MKESPQYKRFKRINFTGNTFTPLNMRSSIICTIQRYIHYPNMPDLKRLEKEAQIKEIDIPKTVKTLSVSDHAFWLFLHLIFEMILILVYYSYERKYYKLTSMFIPDYQCSNIYISIEKRSIDEQKYTIVDTPGHPGKKKRVGVALSLALSGVFGEFSKFKSSSVGLEKRSDFL